MNGVEGERWRRLARNSGKRSLMLIRPVQHSTHVDVLFGSGKLQTIRHTEKVAEVISDVVQMVALPMSFDYSIDKPSDERVKIRDVWGGYYYVTRKYDTTGVNLSGTKILFTKKEDSRFSPKIQKSSYFSATRWSCGGKEYDSYSDMLTEWGRPYVSLHASEIEWSVSYGASVSIPFKDYNDGGGTGSTGSKSFGVSKTFRIRFDGYDDVVGYKYLVVGFEESGNGSVSEKVTVENVASEHTVIHDVNVNDADFPKGKDVPKVRM